MKTGVRADARTPGSWIQVRLAFRIGTAGFALGTRCVAGRTFTARPVAFAARFTFAARTLAGRIATRGAIGTRALPGPVAFAAGLAITGPIRFTAGLAITGPVRFTAGFAFTGPVCFAAGFSVARAVGIAGTLAITRAIRVAWRFAVAGTARFRAHIGWRRRETFTWRRRESAVATTFAIEFPAGRRAVAQAIRRRQAIFGAHPRRRQQLFDGQLAVVIFVERAQRLRGHRNFVFGNDAVAVLVERGDDRRWRRPFPANGRTIGPVTAFAGRWSRRTIRRRLCSREARGKRECECDEGFVVFHDLVLVLFLVFCFV
jgi:hypothetical protein